MYNNCKANHQESEHINCHNQLPLACLKDSFDSSSTRVIAAVNCVINVPLLFLSIIGNSLVLTAVWRSPALRTPFNVHLCGLAVSDLVVGVFVQPLFIIREILNINEVINNQYCILRNVITVGGFVVGGVSFATITHISEDRYLAVHYHMRYPTIVTIPRVLCVIVASWPMSMFVSSLILWNRTVFGISTIFVVSIYLLKSTVVHVKIYRIVRRHQVQIIAQASAVQESNNFNMARFKKSFINTFMVYYLLIVCYVPVSAVVMIQTVKNTSVAPVFWSLVSTPAFANSALNPLLYCWRIQEMRVAVLNLLKKARCKETANN